MVIALNFMRMVKLLTGGEVSQLDKNRGESTVWQTG